MHYIDQTGKGIPTIISKYGKNAFKFSNLYMQCIMPYNIYDKDKLDELFGKINYNKNGDNSDPKNDPIKVSVDPENNIEEKIILIIKNNPFISKKEIAKLIGKSEATVKRVILKSSKIHHIGSRKSGHYEIL